MIVPKNQESIKTPHAVDKPRCHAETEPLLEIAAILAELKKRQ
jgi:hypothetical protein